MTNILFECLKQNKPNISENTLRTYVSLLTSLFNSHHEKTDKINCEWFQNQDHIIKLLKDKKPSSRKTTFAALIALCKDNDKYKKEMMSDAKVYQSFIDTQTKTEKQEENWKSYDDVVKIYETYLKKVKPLLNSKEPLNETELKNLQDLIILALTTGIFIPPRRSLDWIELKIKDINKEQNNYIEKGFFIFNKYKTAKFYDQQKVEIPKPLLTILNKYIKLNPYDYLLTDTKGNKLTNVKLTHRLNNIFGNNISTSMLRHIYLSDKLKDVPALNDLKQMANDMGHSVNEALEYVKKN